MGCEMAQKSWRFPYKGLSFSFCAWNLKILTIVLAECAQKITILVKLTGFARKCVKIAAMAFSPKCSVCARNSKSSFGCTCVVTKSEKPLGVSRKCPGSVPGVSWECPESVPNLKCPESVPKMPKFTEMDEQHLNRGHKRFSDTIRVFRTQNPQVFLLF